MLKTRRNHEKPKLAVFTTQAMMRRLHLERVDAERSIQDLVNDRLLLSYKVHPAPLKAETATV